MLLPVAAIMMAAACASQIGASRANLNTQIVGCWAERRDDPTPGTIGFFYRQFCFLPDGSAGGFFLGGNEGWGESYRYRIQGRLLTFGVPEEKGGNPKYDTTCLIGRLTSGEMELTGCSPAGVYKRECAKPSLRDDVIDCPSDTKRPQGSFT